MTHPRIALCPGSFDPLTVGHEDVIRRALGVADTVVVAVAHNPSRIKHGLFTVPERLEIIRDVFADEPRIEAAVFEGLLADFARQRGATFLIRGLRGSGDLDYEMPMAIMNRELLPGLETVFLAAAPERSFLSGSLVREVASLGGDVSRLVSPPVLRRIRDRLGDVA